MPWQHQHLLEEREIVQAHSLELTVTGTPEGCPFCSSSYEFLSIWTQSLLRWQGRAQSYKRFGVKSKYHQAHIPLQEEHLKPITALSRNAADSSRSGCVQAVWHSYILVLVKPGLAEKSFLWHSHEQKPHATKHVGEKSRSSLQWDVAFNSWRSLFIPR